MRQTRRHFLQTSGGVGLMSTTGHLSFSRLSSSKYTSGSSTANQEQANRSSFNEADIMFLQMMIPHHKEAIEMAKLVPSRTDRPELLELSKSIIREQTNETTYMQRLLKKAGVKPDETMEMEHGHGAMNAEGMEPAEMRELKLARNQKFDLKFTNMMAKHHQGAIEMAQQVIADGRSQKIKQLAKRIIRDQRTEIKQMRRWYRKWS